MQKINFKGIVDLEALVEQFERLSLDEWNETRFSELEAAAEKLFGSSKKTHSFFDKIKSFWNCCIVGSPQGKLEAKIRRMKAQYQEYLRLKEKNAPLLKKLDAYPALSSLGAHSQELFKKIYFLLKLIEAHRSNLKQKLLDSLSHLCSPHHAMQVFKAYEGGLERQLTHHRSREELHCLGFVVGKYRQFFLNSHPDPYIRSRWGFPEEVTGEEPEISHAFAELSLRLEKLDRKIST